MHPPRSSLLAALCISLVGLYSCQREEDLAAPSSPAWSGPTPYQLVFPAWATSPMHDLIIPADNPLTVEGIALGRKLFYEKALSNDYSMSCASCHQQEFAFTDPRTVSVGTDGSLGRRNSMAVVNPAWDHQFFWDGRAPTLEMQAFGPVANMVEMRNTWPEVESRLAAHPEYPLLFEHAFGSPGVDSMRVVKAIAQFERTFISFNSRFDRYEYGGETTALTAQEITGRDLYFGAAHCNDCHAAPFFSDIVLSSIGTDGGSALDHGQEEVTGLHTDAFKFKTNTLRNIGVTAPYMHDGRFATLAAVVDFYMDSIDANSPNISQHMMPYFNGGVELDVAQRAALVAFLNALTDEEFLNNPALSDPN
ncbi:MAG: cytochrome c peroxidase [Flavobacteriales bacterium]